MKKLRHCVLLACALLLASLSTLAQEAWPSRPVKIIVPYPPGGTTDALGRLIAEELGKTIGGTFIVDNRPGGGGTIGSAAVAAAAPDGYTLLISGTGPNSISHALIPTLRYDSLRDFVHVSELINGPNVLFVHPDFFAKNLSDLVNYARANPDKLNYANSVGASSHLAMEYFKLKAGTCKASHECTPLSIQQIPYKGSAPALADVLAGQLPMTMINQDVGYQHVKAGKLRALAVTSAQRNPLYPDVPTIAESGYPGFSVTAWLGLSAPRGTPAPIVSRLEAALKKVFSDPAIRSRLESQGWVVKASTSSEYTDLVAKENVRWKAVVKEAGITID